MRCYRCSKDTLRNKVLHKSSAPQDPQGPSGGEKQTERPVQQIRLKKVSPGGIYPHRVVLL